MNGERATEIWHAMLAREWPRLVLWLPVALGGGIAWFFAASGPTRPLEWGLGAAFAFLAAALAGRVRDHERLRPVALAAMLMGLCLGMLALGGAAAAWRLPRIATPVLRGSLELVKVSGVIEDIVVAPGALKLTLGQLRIDALARRDLPHRLRITSRRYSTEADPGRKRPVDFAIGDRVLMRATLYPAPAPASPGQFDVARNFFFQGIGGVGFSNDRITILKRAEDQRGWRGWVAALRLRVGEEIRQGIGGAEGAIATALVSGQQDAIPQTAVVAMRVAGLSHVLSISGLHLAIAAGIMFVAARMILLLVLPARWRDAGAKKIAAFLALLSSFAYLLLSGAPVAAERSYVMVALVMLAVLLDRQAVSIRSVMLAAFLLLLWQPEMLLSISFQLSFAATLAIVAGAEVTAPWFRRWQSNQSLPAWLRRAGMYLFVSLATSTVATLATAPLVMDGFRQFNSYGVLSNLLLGPLVSLWIMPLVVVCLVLLPFGIPHAVLWALGKGIGGMLALAGWVASLPGAQMGAPSLTPTGYALVIFGGLWLMLWRDGRLRCLGAPAVLLGVWLAFGQAEPVLLLGEDGTQAAAKLPGGWTMLTGSLRNMRAKAWADRVTPETPYQRPADCSLTACAFEIEGAAVLLRFDPRPLRRFRSRAARNDMSPEQRQRREAALQRSAVRQAEKEAAQREEIKESERQAEARCAAPGLSLLIDLRAEPQDCGPVGAWHIARAALVKGGNMALYRIPRNHAASPQGGWRSEQVGEARGQWPWVGVAEDLAAGLSTARSTGKI